MVLLRHVAGFDVPTTARVLGKKAGTVRVAAHRGLARLAEHARDLPGRRCNASGGSNGYGDDMVSQDPREYDAAPDERVALLLAAAAAPAEAGPQPGEAQALAAFRASPHRTRRFSMFSTPSRTKVAVAVDDRRRLLPLRRGRRRRCRRAPGRSPGHRPHLARHAGHRGPRPGHARGRSRRRPRHLRRGGRHRATETDGTETDATESDATETEVESDADGHRGRLGRARAATSPRSPPRPRPRASTRAPRSRPSPPAARAAPVPTTPRRATSRPRRTRRAPPTPARRRSSTPTGAGPARPGTPPRRAVTARPRRAPAPPTKPARGTAHPGRENRP